MSSAYLSRLGWLAMNTAFTCPSDALGTVDCGSVSLCVRRATMILRLSKSARDTGGGSLKRLNCPKRDMGRAALEA